MLSFSSREEKGRTHYQWVCRQNNKTLGCSAQGAKASSSNDTHHTDVLQCHPKKTGTIKTTLSVHEELCSKGTLSEFTSKIVDWHPHYEWKCVGKHTTVICSAKSTVVVQDPATMANQPKCGDTYTGVVKNLLQEGSGLCEDGKVKNFTLLMSPNSTNKYALFSWNCDKENGTKPAVCEARYNYPKDDKPTSTITPTSPPKTDVPSSPSNPQKNGGNGTNAKNDSNTSG